MTYSFPFDLIGWFVGWSVGQEVALHAPIGVFVIKRGSM